MCIFVYRVGGKKGRAYHLPPPCIVQESTVVLESQWTLNISISDKKKFLVSPELSLGKLVLMIFLLLVINKKMVTHVLKFAIPKFYQLY